MSGAVVGSGGSAVEFRGIRRSYGATHALAGLDLALKPGELLAHLRAALDRSAGRPIAG